MIGERKGDFELVTIMIGEMLRAQNFIWIVDGEKV